MKIKTQMIGPTGVWADAPTNARIHNQLIKTRLIGTI